MSVFMEKNGVWQDSNHLRRRTPLQLQPGGLTFGQVITPYLKFIRASKYVSASERNVHSAITAFKTSSRKEVAAGKKIEN